MARWFFFFFLDQKYEGTKKANKQNKMNKTKKKRKATTTESFQSGAVEGLDPTPRQKGKPGKGREEKELWCKSHFLYRHPETEMYIRKQRTESV